VNTYLDPLGICTGRGLYKKEWGVFLNCCGALFRFAGRPYNSDQIVVTMVSCIFLLSY
jgi:hypothetical protein